MPYPLTETAKLARRHGLTYAATKYRLANNIPLDAPSDARPTVTVVLKPRIPDSKE